MIRCCRKSSVEMLRIIIIMGDDFFYVERGGNFTKILKLIFYFLHFQPLLNITKTKLSHLTLSHTIDLVPNLTPSTTPAPSITSSVFPRRTTPSSSITSTSTT